MSVWACSECGSTEKNRRAKGLCQKCYQLHAKARRYEADPTWRGEESKKSYERHREAIIKRTTARNRAMKWEVIRTIGREMCVLRESAPGS
jgi:hypothetical protein